MFWCRFGFHKWGKWIDVDLLSSSPLFGIEPHIIQGQQKICSCCGKRELKS